MRFFFQLYFSPIKPWFLIVYLTRSFNRFVRFSSSSGSCSVWIFMCVLSLPNAIKINSNGKLEQSGKIYWLQVCLQMPDCFQCWHRLIDWWLTKMPVISMPLKWINTRNDFFFWHFHWQQQPTIKTGFYDSFSFFFLWFSFFFFSCSMNEERKIKQRRIFLLTCVIRPICVAILN